LRLAAKRCSPEPHADQLALAADVTALAKARVVRCDILKLQVAQCGPIPQKVGDRLASHHGQRSAMGIIRILWEPCIHKASISSLGENVLAVVAAVHPEVGIPP
jgi:hypothetical protein